ncbi:DUF6143 family protein [Mechercharimyces sp. CAU 1602]|uniref:DUF6143 family protein n=1 Tax=Mechercharimyces sp. CAU 1602 TaxID=2973933 RepID=UPI0037C74C8A|nr:DUF6143 family protein [Mechercharimyces sp. CAU 1602]
MSDQLQTVTTIPPTPELIRRVEGKHFSGQSGLLSPEGARFAWAGLFNPLHSGVNVVLDTAEKYNLSSQPMTAKILFNALPTGRQITSSQISSTNTSPLRSPSPIPRAKVKFNSATTSPFKGGKFISIRRLPANSTVITPITSLGSVIIAPRSTLISVFISPSPTKARESFAWWEVPLQECRK